MRETFYFVLFFSLSFHVQSKAFLEKKFRIKFTKELKSILKKKRKSEGTLTYQYPGKIRIEQQRPFKTMYISNGKQAWIYSAPFDPKKEKGEVSLIDPRRVPLTKVLDELTKGLKSNKVYRISKKDKTLTLNFYGGNKKKYQIEHVKIEMNHPMATGFKNMKTFTIKTLNATEYFEIVDVDLSPSLPPGHFDFKITEKMKVARPL